VTRFSRFRSQPSGNTGA